jgi:hypothetical protein
VDPGVKGGNVEEERFIFIQTVALKRPAGGELVRIRFLENENSRCTGRAQTAGDGLRESCRIHVYSWSDLCKTENVAFEARGSLAATLILEDRSFPTDSRVRTNARALYQQLRKLPIISLPGHKQTAWFARRVDGAFLARLFARRQLE